MIKNIGIRREDKNKWERRVPVIPEHMRQLVQLAGFNFFIQPSNHRVFTEQEFVQWGASVAEDLSHCDVILNVKEVPVEKILADKIYLLFSHTIKGQAHNLPMLRRFMEQRCTLIDYECITDDQGKRLVFFGRYAGMAGMLETLRGLGMRWLQLGWNTPLAEILPAFAYGTVEEARLHITSLEQQLAHGQGPFNAGPVIVGFSGYGQVAKGAQEIFDLLPCRTLAPDKLAEAKPWHGFYKTVFTEADMFAPRQADETFNLTEYYRHPEKYRSRFDGYLSYLTVLVNGIYWDQRYPRLVTKAKIAELYRNHNLPLQVIGDISCDIHGAIECTERTTTPDQPFFTYHPESGVIQDDIAADGVAILAVDNLPATLPRDASTGFSEALWPLLAALASSDMSSFASCALPSALQRAVILFNGELTPAYRYLAKYLE